MVEAVVLLASSLFTTLDSLGVVVVVVVATLGVVLASLTLGFLLSVSVFFTVVAGVASA